LKVKQLFFPLISIIIILIINMAPKFHPIDPTVAIRYSRRISKIFYPDHGTCKTIFLLILIALQFSTLF